MTDITIAHIARTNSIPPGTISMNIQYLLDAFPDLKKQMRRNK